MRHRSNVKTLDRKSAARKALYRTLAISLITHGRIRTSKAKATAVRPFVERLVTRAKTKNEATRRYLLTRLGNAKAVDHLMENVAPDFAKRPGGYTRTTKLGFRKGDGAELVQLEFVN